MKRVVLTGGTGFVGANLARRLLRDGHEVHLLVRASHSSWRIDEIRADLRLHQVNVADAEGLRRAVATIRPEWVFHLAAYGAYPSQTDVGTMIQTNVVGTANLVEASLPSGCEAFVNTGSSSEYGFKRGAPAEDEALEPNSYYAVTKASSTLFCRYTAHQYQVRMPTLRLYSVYGAYEEPGRLIPTLVMRGRRNELPPLADPDTARDYVYVDDVCEAYLLAARRPTAELGAVYNVGTGVQTTLRGVVEIARRVLEVTAEPNWGSMPSRSWDAPVWVSDSRKIREQLGWEPRHSLEAGLRLTADWFNSPRRPQIYG